MDLRNALVLLNGICSEFPRVTTHGTALRSRLKEIAGMSALPFAI